MDLEREELKTGLTHRRCSPEWKTDRQPKVLCRLTAESRSVSVALGGRRGEAPSFEGQESRVQPWHICVLGVAESGRGMGIFSGATDRSV